MLTLGLIWISAKYNKEYAGLSVITAFLDILIIFIVAAVVVSDC